MLDGQRLLAKCSMMAGDQTEDAFPPHESAPEQNPLHSWTANSN
jgi:hypothetical protein